MREKENKIKNKINKGNKRNYERRIVKLLNKYEIPYKKVQNFIFYP